MYDYVILGKQFKKLWSRMKLNLMEKRIKVCIIFPYKRKLFLNYNVFYSRLAVCKSFCLKDRCKQAVIEKLRFLFCYFIYRLRMFSNRNSLILNFSLNDKYAL